MSELPSSGDYHGDTEPVRGGNDLLISNRAARLNHGFNARFGSNLDAVGKGKERIGGHDAA
jgi:hypothetical protein